MATFLQTLTAAEAALDEMYRANKELLRLAKAHTADLEANQPDPAKWRRLPAGTARCPVSGLSRSSLYRLIRAGQVRRKSIGNAAYYATADLRLS